jgi:hypothetical protein
MSTPLRHGQPWADDEIQKLLQAIKRKDTLEQIAESHQRSTGGVRGRLRQLAADYYFNDNRSIEQIMIFTGLDKATIVDVISRRERGLDSKKEKISIVPSAVEVKKEGRPMITLLTEIRDIMKEMLEIMKKNEQTNSI